jgi:hypothetical protein
MAPDDEVASIVKESTRVIINKYKTLLKMLIVRMIPIIVIFIEKYAAQ